MDYSKFEIVAKERGYTITPDGIVYNKHNKSVGTSGKSKYKYFSFRIEGKIIKVYFHRFQAYSKFGEKIYNDNIVVRHLDGNLLNNSISNIDIGTSSDNMMDISEKSKTRKNLQMLIKKYSDDTVLKIQNGMSYKELMYKIQYF